MAGGDKPCVLECITYHEGSRRMRARTFIGPFPTFDAAHACMHTDAMLNAYDDMLIHQLTPPEAPSDAHPNDNPNAG